jgi:glycosyltransferase involved in cell wall biosynthesis
MEITVLTSSLPERHEMLAEAMTSISAQTLAPVAHLIGVDHARTGHVPVLNRLVSAAASDWVARLDDDDLLDPNHLEVLAESAGKGDVIYSWCRIQGRAGITGERLPIPDLQQLHWDPNQHFDADLMRERNFIPATGPLIRRSLVEQLGGWRDDRPGGMWEDGDFWVRALDAGAHFHCVPQITWTYRFHGGNLWLR